MKRGIPNRLRRLEERHLRPEIFIWHWDGQGRMSLHSTDGQLILGPEQVVEKARAIDTDGVDRPTTIKILTFGEGGCRYEPVAR